MVLKGIKKKTQLTQVPNLKTHLFQTQVPSDRFLFCPPNDKVLTEDMGLSPNSELAAKLGFARLFIFWFPMTPTESFKKNNTQMAT